MKHQRARRKRDRELSTGIESRASALPLILTAAAVALVSFAVFLPALENGFVDWDDPEMLLNHAHYRGFGGAELRWMFTTFHMGHYQPLSWLSFAVDHLLWGTNAAGYHLTNVMLHVANAVVFFFIARRLLTIAQPDASRAHPLACLGGAMLAALLFAIHPLRVESVAWVTERRDVLSGLFYLLTLQAYLAARESPDGDTRRRGLAVSVGLYALSLLAKGTAMTLPVVLVLLDVYPLRRLSGGMASWAKPQFYRVWLEKLPFAALALTFAIVALLAQQSAGALRPVQQYFLTYRLGQLFYSFCFYLWKTVLPTQLSPLYELPYDFDAWMPLFGLCAVFVIAVSATLIFFRRRWPAALAAWIYYLVVLAPVAGVAQSGPQLVADRYSYLSCLGWAMLAGGGFAAWAMRRGSTPAGRRQVACAAIAAAVGLTTLAALTWRQNGIWADSDTLWRHAVNVTPRSSVAHYNLARRYEDQGAAELSLQHYRRAVENNPLYADAHYNLARLLAKSGRENEAEKHYRAALQVRPGDPEARNNLGLLLARRGETAAALDQLSEAVRLDPRYGKAHFNLGRLHAAKQDLSSALESYRRALELHPGEAEIQVALARTLAALGRKEEAEEHYRQAIKILQQTRQHNASEGIAR